MTEKHPLRHKKINDLVFAREFLEDFVKYCQSYYSTGEDITSDKEMEAFTLKYFSHSKSHLNGLKIICGFKNKFFFHNIQF